MQKKPPYINIIIAALLAVSTTLIGLLSGIAPNELPPATTPYLRFTWPLLGIATLVFVGLTILQTVRQSSDEHDVTIPRSEHRQNLLEKQNRQRMLAKVHAFWIKGVLEQSLHGAALIALGLKEQPDAIENPWRLVLQEADQSEQPLPSGTRITKVYDDAGGELLILGEPGSGKTTLLLELACDLLDRAHKDDAYPIPVVFNLSSWVVKRQSIADWMVEELKTKYQVPHKLGKSWVNDDQILPLLDGLDEVAKEHRASCVDAINTYRREHGIVPTVVCSRSTEYLTQIRQVLLHSAVVVKPLTAQQIDDYLSSAERQLAPLRVALRDDLVLQELATTPLMLSILTLAYHGMAVEDILAERTPEPRRRQVFETYVRRMMERRGTGARYSPQQTIYWLTWLAQQMQQKHLTEFYLERLQPAWLPTKRSRTLYHVLSGLSFLGLACGLFGTLLGALLKGLNGGLIGALFIGLVGMLVGGLLGKVGSADQGIRPAEILKWSWKNAKPWLVIGPIFGLAIGLIGGLAFRLPGGLTGGLIFALVLALVLALVGGLSGEQINEDMRVNPNQGIRSSGWNALRTGLVCVLVGAPGVGLVGGPVVGLIGGLSFGLLGGLVFGGVAYILHFVLRFLLWRAGYMPLNYIQFLDYAADRILLRKVGGGYIFVHRLLLEYFASLDTATKSNDMAKRP